MKKLLLISVATLSLAAGAAFAEKVKDWHDIDKVHSKIVTAIQDMERARAANHYDMAGHGARAEELLKQAEHELHESVEAARMAK